MSFSGIGRLLGVSDVAVPKWVRSEATGLPEPVVPASVATVEADGTWHVVKEVCQALGVARP